MKSIAIYDTTLRDGAQGEGISFSNPGKIRVARYLDEFGVDYIEGGYAASNPKDMAFFRDIKKEALKHAKIAAFGSTRRSGVSCSDDAGTIALLDADTSVCTLFGKSWRLHVTDVLRTTEDENRAMIRDTVQHLKNHGREVIYDAEHFFDGYKDNPEHALSTLQAAAEAGADILVLCDTNGGTLPHEVTPIVEAIRDRFDLPVGIHAHNDSECGVANSLAAIHAGAVQVQGTINGFGERCGNANLSSIIPNLVLKMNCTCLEHGHLNRLKEVSTLVNEMANVRPNKKAAFTGASAFAHKAGMHVDGVRKNAQSFEHIDPTAVGNERRILISELSGASNVFLKAVEMGMELSKTSPEVKGILGELERLEKEGYEYEAAEASFKLLIQKVLKAHKPFFELEGFRVMVEKQHPDEPCLSEATVKLRLENDEVMHTVAEGDGPVNALDGALRKALREHYPQISDVFLTDFRVRILDPEEHTAAKTRVLIESSDGVDSWSTVGVSENLIEASWEALVDGVEYKMFLEEEKAKKTS